MASDKVESRRVPYFGDFVVFDEIGRGGMGVVYRAQQSSLDRAVALKVLHEHLAANHASVQRLRAEAEAVARLDHPNIVPIFEVGEHEGRHYLALQYIEGESLAEQLKSHSQGLMPAHAAKLLTTMARAVHHAHQRGVLHRDLKPGNIIIDPAGEPHLIDFGIAKSFQQDMELTQTGAFLGTPAYTSPEQAMGHTKSVTLASDIYSLGAMLYALLTGRPPFDGASLAEVVEQVKANAPRPPRSLVSTLPADLETICLKCLEKEPAKRYGSALVLAEDLERFLEGKPIAARPTGLVEKFWMWARRKPVHAALWATAVLAVLGSLTGALLWKNLQHKAQENQNLIELGSTIAQVRNHYPRAMNWSEEVRRHFAPGQVATQKSYYRDQIASTLEGLDARPIGQHTVIGTRQMFFDVTGQRLHLVGATNVESWAGQTNRDSATSQPLKVPGEPVGFPADAPFILCRTTNGSLHVWDTVNQRSLCELIWPSSLAPLKQARFPFTAASADGSTLAVLANEGGQEASWHLWRVASGELIRSIAVDSSTTGVALSSDGSLAVRATKAGQVQLWEISSGQLLGTLLVSRCPVVSLALARSVRGELTKASWLLAAGDECGSIFIYDLATQNVQTICRGGHYQIRTLAFSPDNMLLASGGRGPVRLWNLTTGTPLLDLEGDYCSLLTFSPDGRRLAASMAPNNPDGTRITQLWELQNGRGVATLKGMSGSVTKVVFSQQGDRVAGIGMDWEIGVWSLNPLRLLHLLEAPQGISADNSALAFSPDGGSLAVVAGKEARMWDVASGRLIRHWKLPSGYVDVMSFPTTNSLLLLRTEAGQVCRLRNLMAADPLAAIQEIKDFNLRVLDAAVSANGRFFVIEGMSRINGELSRKLLVMDASSGTAVWESRVARPFESAMNVFTSRGTHLAYTLDGTNYLLRDVADLQQPPELLPGRFVAVGPRPSLLASIGDKRGINLYEDGELRVSVGMDSGMMLRAEFDQAGRWLAWGNKDGSVSLCNLAEMRSQLSRFGLVW